MECLETGETKSGTRPKWCELRASELMWDGFSKSKPPLLKASSYQADQIVDGAVRFFQTYKNLDFLESDCQIENWPRKVDIILFFLVSGIILYICREILKPQPKSSVLKRPVFKICIGKEQ